MNKTKPHSYWRPYGKPCLLALIVVVSCGLWLLPSAWAKNLHLIDSTDNGFAIYRSGTPNGEDIAQWCKLGITEVMVLSGNAEQVEKKLIAEHCLGLKVIYNQLQNAKIPVTESFLSFFDNWVSEARASGKKILFRCSCGCHRTGRLAGYYEMKYMKRTKAQAYKNMLDKGRQMFLYPYLAQQLDGLNDFAAQAPCRYSDTEQAKNYCVSQ